MNLFWYVYHFDKISQTKNIQFKFQFAQVKLSNRVFNKNKNEMHPSEFKLISIVIFICMNDNENGQN